MDSPEQMSSALAEHGYLADDALATSLFLALRMGRPLLLEGEAGAGKTEVANVIARWTGGELVRLQCYDGIDVSQAVYEWDYARQLLHLRALDSAAAPPREMAEVEHALYSEEYLVRRPLLRAIAATANDGPVPVLLIDEIDRADDEFEAYLLEILSDFSVTVPELGTFRAERAAHRDRHLQSERATSTTPSSGAASTTGSITPASSERSPLSVCACRVRRSPLAREVAAVTAELRQRGLYKPPGVAEIDRLGPGAPGTRFDASRRKDRRTNAQAPWSNTAKTPSACAQEVWLSW